MRTNITKTSMELIQSPPVISLLQVQSPKRNLESVWRRNLGGALDQLHGSFSDINAHQDFQKPKFVMPELLINELWLHPTQCKRKLPKYKKKYYLYVGTLLKVKHHSAILFNFCSFAEVNYFKSFLRLGGKILKITFWEKKILLKSVIFFQIFQLWFVIFFLMRITF